MPDEMNLADIVGRDDYDSRRVAWFQPNGERMEITEACDDYFGVALDRAEVQRLVDYLSAWLDLGVRHPEPQR